MVCSVALTLCVSLVRTCTSSGVGVGSAVVHLLHYVAPSRMLRVRGYGARSTGKM